VCIVFGSNGVAFGESLRRLVGHGLEAKRIIQWLWITFHSDWSLCGFVEKFIYASIQVCYNCGKKGHFASVCKDKKRKGKPKQGDSRLKAKKDMPPLTSISTL
jgi:hypothetical protein